MSVDPQLDGGRGDRGMGVAQSSRTDSMCVWVPSLSGLRGTGLHSGYCAGLYRPGGHNPVERRSWVCVSQALQALRPWPGKAEIMQACAARRSSCNSVQAWRVQPSRMEIVGVYLSCGRPFGHGPTEQRSCRAVQNWGHGLAEIMNVCGSPALSSPWRKILQV
jgi:hypothetical protein